MRNLRQLDEFRQRERAREVYGYEGDSTCGMFILPSPTDGAPLRVIAAVGMGWEHVSVSRSDRTPTWVEMEFIKHRFFLGHETAMQLHVPALDHVNTHPFCLHLWRPTERQIPRPPAFMVG